MAVSLRASALPRVVKVAAVLAWTLAAAPYFFVSILPHWVMLPFLAVWLAPISIVAFYEEVSIAARVCAGLSIPLMVWLMFNYFGYETAG